MKSPKTTVELNNMLTTAISNMMTDEQLDAFLPSLGMTTRQVLVESIVYMGGAIPDESLATKGSAQTGRIKAYWHHHGYLSATKPNAEWQPLVLEI